MGIWNKLFSAVKGGVNEAAESVADSQALRILDQEIREAEASLRKSDEAIVSIMAKRKLSQTKVDNLKGQIAEYEQHALKAANANNQELALECAQRVASLRQELTSEEQFLATFEQSEQAMRSNITQAKAKMKQLQQQVDVVKANDSVQKAQAHIAQANSGASSKMSTAVDSLERIKQKQAEQQAKFEASEELMKSQQGTDLDKKLAEAGIIAGGTSSAEDELARILGKK